MHGYDERINRNAKIVRHRLMVYVVKTREHACGGTL